MIAVLGSLDTSFGNAENNSTGVTDVFLARYLG